MAVGLVVGITGDTKGLQGALGEAEGKVSGFGAKIGDGALKVAALAGGIGLAVGAVVSMTDAAAKDRAEQEKLTLAIKNAGAATANSNAQVDDAIAKGQDLAFSDSETRDALAKLVTTTHDMTKASALLTTAQDVSRAAHVDLATAASAVAKAQAGQDGALRKLLPGLAKGKTATDTLANASKLAAGQAKLFANTSEGTMARASDAFSEVQETIGSAFLPVLDELLPALIPIIRTLGQLIQLLLPILVPALRVVASVFGIVLRAISAVVSMLINLISWVGRAIAKLQSLVPHLDIHLPFGIGGTSATGGGGAPAGASSQAAARGAGGSAGGITVNVSGALDPEAVARQIRAILAGHDSRVGRTVAI